MTAEEIKKYVMDTPGNTNPAVLTSMLNQVGGSLPSVIGSGKALVSVNGEWEEQDGYGYIEHIPVSTIEWDGETEGRTPCYMVYGGEKAPAGYKVSDETFIDLQNCGSAQITLGDQALSADVALLGSDEGFSLYIISVGEPFPALYTGNPGMHHVTYQGVDLEIEIVEKGTYFFTESFDESSIYISSWTHGGDITHKIDEKYLPSYMDALMDNTVRIPIRTDDYPDGLEEVYLTHFGFDGSLTITAYGVSNQIVGKIKRQDLPALIQQMIMEYWARLLGTPRYIELASEYDNWDSPGAVRIEIHNPLADEFTIVINSGFHGARILKPSVVAM